MERRPREREREREGERERERESEGVIKIQIFFITRELMIYAESVTSLDYIIILKMWNAF